MLSGSCRGSNNFFVHHLATNTNTLFTHFLPSARCSLTCPALPPDRPHLHAGIPVRCFQVDSTINDLLHVNLMSPITKSERKRKQAHWEDIQELVTQDWACSLQQRKQQALADSQRHHRQMQQQGSNNGRRQSEHGSVAAAAAQQQQLRLAEGGDDLAEVGPRNNSLPRTGMPSRPRH